MPFTYGAWTRADDGVWKNNTTGAIATPAQIPTLEKWSGYTASAPIQTGTLTPTEQLYAQTGGMAAPAQTVGSAYMSPATGALPADTWQPGQPLKGAPVASSFATDPAALVASLLQPQTTIIDENNNTQMTPAHAFNEQGILMAPPQRDQNYDSESGLPEYMPARPYVFKLANGNGGVLGRDGTVADTGMTFNEADNGSLRDPLQFAAMAATAYFGAQALGNLAGAQLPMDAGIDFGSVTSPATTGALPSAAEQAMAEGFRAGELAGQAPGSTQVAGAAQSPQLPLDYGVDFGTVTQPTNPLSNITGGTPAGTGPLSNITGTPGLSAGTPTGTAATTGGIGLNTAIGGAGAAAAVAGLGGDPGTGLTAPGGALGETLPNVNTGPTTYPPDVTVNPNLNTGQLPGGGITPALPNIVTLPTIPTTPNIPTPGALPPANPTPPPDDRSIGDPDDTTPPPDDTTPPPDNVTPPPGDRSIGDPPPDDNITPPPDDPSLGDPPDGSDPGLVDYIKKLGTGALNALGFMKDGKIDWAKALAAGGLLAGLYQGSKPATSSVKQELPEWYTKGSQEALALAKQYADKGFEPYTGEAIAPLSANENAAIEMAKNAAGQWEPVAKQGADLVAKGALPVSRDDIQGYVNPALAGIGTNQVASMYDEAGNLVRSGTQPIGAADVQSYIAPALSDIVNTDRAGKMYDRAGNLIDAGAGALSTTDIARYRNPDLASITSSDRINATYDEAGNLLRSGAADLTGDDIRGLMNPYVDLAYAPAKRALERDLAAKQAIARATAVSRGAFGTDRQTLQDSQLTEAGLTALGDLYGTSYKNAFDSATRLGAEGKGRKLTAGGAMASMGNSLAGLSTSDWTNATNTAKSNLDRSITAGGALGSMAGQVGTLANNAWNTGLTAAGADRTRSLTGANTLYGAAGALGNLTNTAWGQGINASQADRDRMIKGGGALSDIATEGSALTDADIKRLGATGALDRSVRQAKNDFDYGQYQDRLKFPTTAIGNYATALRGAPGNTTTTTAAPPNVLGETIGALGAWNSWFNTPGKG